MGGSDESQREVPREREVLPRNFATHIHDMRRVLDRLPQYKLASLSIDTSNCLMASTVWGGVELPLSI